MRHGRPRRLASSSAGRSPTCCSNACRSRSSCRSAALSLAVVVGVPLGVIAGYRHNSQDRRGHRGRRQRRRVDARLLAGAHAAVHLRQSLGDTPLGAAAVRPAHAGVDPEPFYEAWGLGRELACSSSSPTSTRSTPSSSGDWDIFWDAVAAPDPAGHRAGHHPDGDHRPHDPVEPARRARASTTSAPLGPRACSERLVVVRHALRNSLLPVVTVIGLSLGTLIGGAILTETIFNLTGVGKTLFDAITARDYTVVQGFTLVVAIGFVIINLITDIVYTFLDPKVRVTEWPIDPAEPGPASSETQAEAAVTARPLKPRPVARRLPRDAAQAVGAGRRGAARLPRRSLAVFAPLIAPYGPNEVLLGTEGVERPRPALRPPASGAIDDEAAAPPRHRRQRPRRVQPDRLRRPGLAARRRGGGVVRRGRSARSSAWSPASSGGWIDNALMRVHGRAAGVPRAAAGHRHRHRARAAGCSTPSSPSRS